MSVWIVFEYDEYNNKIIGIYRNRERAQRKQKIAPTWRYIEEHEVE